MALPFYRSKCGMGAVGCQLDRPNKRVRHFSTILDGDEDRFAIAFFWQIHHCAAAISSSVSSASDGEMLTTAAPTPIHSSWIFPSSHGEPIGL